MNQKPPGDGIKDKAIWEFHDRCMEELEKLVLEYAKGEYADDIVLVALRVSNIIGQTAQIHTTPGAPLTVSYLENWLDKLRDMERGEMKNDEDKPEPDVQRVEDFIAACEARFKAVYSAVNRGQGCNRASGPVR